MRNEKESILFVYKLYVGGILGTLLGFAGARITNHYFESSLREKHKSEIRSHLSDTEQTQNTIRNARIADINSDNQLDLILPYSDRNHPYLQTDNGLVPLQDYFRKKAEDEDFGLRYRAEKQQERSEQKLEVDRRRLWHESRKAEELTQKVADDIMKKKQGGKKDDR